MTLRSWTCLVAVTLLPACGAEDTPSTTAQPTTTTFSETGETSGGGTGDEGATMSGTTAGDGDTGDGDGTTGDGDGTTGDGDGTTGDGDGTTGDGDGTTGDGDGTTGDGDGTTGDGDGATGDGDGTTGDGTTGDGDGTTSGDGDGTTGDGTTGDGDGDGTTSGDGDGDGCAGTPGFCPMAGATHECDPTGMSFTQVCQDNGAGCNTWQQADDCVADLGDNFAICNSTTAMCESPQPCLTEQPMVTFEPPNLVLVLDKSGSMLAPFSGSTRWDVLKDVVTNVTQTYENTIKFGAKWFPTALTCETGTNCYCDGFIVGSNCCTDIFCLGLSTVGCEGNACDVTAGFDTPGLAPALNNSANIVTALPDATAIDGFCWTPTETGFEDSLAAAQGLLPAGEDLYMMLVIDGAVSDGTQFTQGCLPAGTVPPPFPYSETDAGLLSAIQGANTAGVNTFVVAIDATGAGTTTQANNYANAGGVPNPAPGSSFYPGDNQTELFAAMDQIAASLVTCDIQLSIPPPNPNLVDVQVMGVQYSQLQVPPADCATDDGWYFSDAPTNQVITLCGQACTDFTGMSVPTADVSFFCTAG